MPQEEIIEDTGIESMNKKKGFGSRLWAFAERNWSWLLAVAIVFIFMVTVSAIMSVAPLGRNSFSCIDSMHQYVPFFSDYQRKVRGLESLYYTWNIGMGQNYLSLLLYYIASPLNLILLVVPRSGIFGAFTFLVIFKLCFSAGAFGYWLSRRRGVVSNSPLITGFSLGYALSSYMIGYHWNVMWLDCIMMLPLAILGLERIFRKKSPKLYVLSLFYILFCNYYIAFIICIFLVLWFFAHKQGSFKDFLRNGLVFAGCSLLSALMAAAALLTAFLGIMQTSSAESMGLPKEKLYGSFFAQLKQHFFLTTPIDMQNDDSGLNVYCGVLIVLLFFLFLLSDRISLRERIRKGLLVAFLIYSFNSTLFNFIWHGFHNQYGIPNRFSFVYIFTLLTVGYEALVRLRQTGVFRIALAGSLTIIFFFLCFWFGDPKGAVPGGWIFAITLALVVVYMVFLFLRKLNGIPLLAGSIVLASMLAAELITNGALGFAKNDVANGDFYAEYTDAMITAKQNVDRLAELKSEKFWREDMVSTRMIDEATYHGLRSVGTFCSTVKGKLVDVMGRLGCYTAVNEFLFYGGNPVLNMLTGVRYIYTRDTDYSGIMTRETPVYEDKDLKVYENPYVLPIAYGVPMSMENWESAAGDRIGEVNRLAREMTGIGKVYETATIERTAEGEGCKTWVTSPTSKLINYSKDQDATGNIKITTELTITEDGSYVFDTRVNHVKRLQIHINDEQKARDRFTSQIFDLGKLKVGDRVKLVFEFDSDASESGTVRLELCRINEEKLQQIYDKLADEGMEVTYVKDGKLDGVVTMKEDGLLFTTIPYDEGWTVKVDGEKVETMAVGEAFLALPLSAGQHTVTFRYTAPGFLRGLLLSLCGWVLYFVIFHIRRQKKRKKTVTIPLHKEEKDI